MKLFSKYMFVALMSIFVLASCSDDDKYVPGEQETADKVGVYFPTTDGGNNEIDPADPTEFSIKVARMNTNGAVSVPLIVKTNENDVYQIPATADFADGAAETTVKVTFPDAEPGEAYTVTIEIPEEYFSLYKENADKVSFSTTYTRVKWENAGTGYWVGNIINTFSSGVNPLPMYVEYETASTATAVKYRFNSPYGVLATADDEMGAFNGYLYNEEGDLSGNGGTFVITVTKDGASLAPVQLGMDWGYGEFSIGQMYGYVSANIDNYPLGVFEASETGGVITWAAGSLYVSMASYNSGARYPCAAGSSYFFLSKEDYAAFLEK